MPASPSRSSTSNSRTPRRRSRTGPSAPSNAISAAEECPRLGDNPLDDLRADFTRRMAALGPYEAAPHIAVAVSGGTDSLALMHLLESWCAERQGRLTVLTVDHGLRPEAAAEARQVAGWAGDIGAETVTLAWQGEKPVSGLQDAARRARYDLMADWCRAAGVLHLIVAHQADDQRETVAMRQARAQGEGARIGLAGMSAVVSLQGVRLLRPLLGVPRQRLADYLRAEDRSWIEDPSNSAAKFERVRWRLGLMGPLPELDAVRFAGLQRIAAERAVADFLMRRVVLAPAGHALVDMNMAEWGETAALAIGQLVSAVGGEPYRPALSSLKRDVSAVLETGRTRSLGGCLIARHRRQVLVCREAAAAEAALILAGVGDNRSERYRWDRRFDIEIGPTAPPLSVGVLGESGLRELAEIPGAMLNLKDIPAPSRAGLPACRDATGRLIRVPFTGFDPFGLKEGVTFRFRPNISATSSGFTVA